MPLITGLAALAAFAAATPAVADMDPEVRGIGLYGKRWQPEPIFEYWHPEAFRRPGSEAMEGSFTGEECAECHADVTPGIVNDWRASRHARPSPGNPPVGCDACHGADHQALSFPTPATCGGCHEQQHRQLAEERRYGFPSHALAMERAVDADHFVDKPKAEVAVCLQCHSVATKCDSCHTRHRFDPAEARRPEACITCHTGPPHPDDDTYFASAHGRRYLRDGDQWDWSRPLSEGNYPAPTCAYCHLTGGNHQVADKAIWKFGLLEINPRSPENRVKRSRWVAVCDDCHPAEESRGWLEEVDSERKQAWSKLYTAERILRGLRWRGQLSPAPRRRPPFPNDWLDRIWPRARIGFYEGQASAFYNVSRIERDYFEMWYFDSLGAYKAAAHGDGKGVREGHHRLDRALEAIRQEAATLRRLDARRGGDAEGADPGDLWRRGEYTSHNREHN